MTLLFQCLDKKLRLSWFRLHVLFFKSRNLISSRVLESFGGDLEIPEDFLGNWIFCSNEIIESENRVYAMNSTFFSWNSEKNSSGRNAYCVRRILRIKCQNFFNFHIEFFSAFLEEVRTNFLSLLIFIIRCPCGTCEEKRFCRTAKIEK